MFKVVEPNVKVSSKDVRPYFTRKFRNRYENPEGVYGSVVYNVNSPKI